MSEPGQSPKETEPPIVPYVRQIFCDLLNPSRGVVVSGAVFGSTTIELMIDGNMVMVDKKMFASAMAAYL